MALNPARWFPVAVALSILNLAAVWFAAMPGEPLHATAHAVAAVGFGLWASRLRQRLGGRARAVELELQDLDALEVEMEQMRQELGEAQERLDLAERLLAQQPEGERVDDARWKPKHPQDTGDQPL